MQTSSRSDSVALKVLHHKGPTNLLVPLRSLRFFPDLPNPNNDTCT